MENRWQLVWEVKSREQLYTAINQDSARNHRNRGGKRASFSNNRKIAVKIVFLVIILTIGNFTEKAQDYLTGALEGIVYDEEHKPVEKAVVKISSLDTESTAITYTDGNGRFYRNSLTPGLYLIKISADRFQDYEVKNEILATMTKVLLPDPVLKPLKTKVDSSEKTLITGNLAVASNPNSMVKVTSSDGKFVYDNTIFSDQLLTVFDHISVGQYTVGVTLEGYKPSIKEIDIQPNKTSTLSFSLQSYENLTKIRDQAGKYYALIIGSNQYQNFSHLKTAENDAISVEKILKVQFGFETQLLLNANREQILSALGQYRRKVEPNSNLLIYFAGHGYNDKDADEAYWLPVNAGKDDNANWISADDITRSIKTIPSKHILVVSDSCYSGALSRSAEIIPAAAPTARETFLLKIINDKSRILLASGGDEPVLDGGGDRNHSIFNDAFANGLLNFGREIFTAEELFTKSIKERVGGHANQIPEYSAIKNSGHESGDFVFIQKPLRIQSH